MSEELITKAIWSRKKKIQKKKDTPFISHEDLQKRLELFDSLKKSELIPAVELSPPHINESQQATLDKFNEKGLRYYKDQILKSEDEAETQEVLEKQKQAEKETKAAKRAEAQASKKLSRKKEKEFFKSKVSQLKVIVERPDLVEAWDVTAPDPLLLIHLKSLKSSIPVPKHWSQKKKFLQAKRGSFKRPFRLPDFIEATGISKLRDPLSEISSIKMIKQKLKERMNPRLGKIDIDYQTLHDAFFKNQTKPKMTMFGDIFYEGKEEDQKIRAFRPGKISSELRTALGISETGNVPWLLSMHKFGPPPAYPNMKLNGFNMELFKKSLGEKVKEENEDEDWEWVNEKYLFGAVQEDKIDDEEMGYEVENAANYGEDVELHQLNEDNPYFMLESFQPVEEAPI